MKRVAIVLAFVALIAFPARAYDFAVRMSRGDTLYLEVTDAQKRLVTVVAPNSDGPDYYYGHKRPSGVLVVPSDVIYEGQHYTVTAIGERAFSGCTAIRMVSLAPTVTEIGAYAFYGCTGINEKVSIGENVTKIGPSAFYGCVSLPEVSFRAIKCEFMGGSMGSSVFGNCKKLKRVKIDDGVTRIPDYAFSGVDAIASPLTLPQSLEYIGDYAFAFCNKIPGDLVIPDKVKSVGTYAFCQCHSLSSLTIGASVERMGDRAFYQCIGLQSLLLKPQTPPAMESSTFAALSQRVACSVPCVSKELYGADQQWKKMVPLTGYGSCSLLVLAEAAKPVEATVLGSGNYKYGDSVELVVACAMGYGFAGWSDGNTENPRTVVVRKNMDLKAYTQVAQTLTRTDTVYRTDTIYKGGYKVVHDTVDFFETVRPYVEGKSPLKYDADSKKLEWNLADGEMMLSLMLFNARGECLYRSERSEGKLKMRHFGTGMYFVRLETARGVESYRIFVNGN